jgi:hypothetical protein
MGVKKKQLSSFTLKCKIKIKEFIQMDWDGAPFDL